DFTASGFGIVRAAEPARVVELADAANQDLVPRALLERWGIASMLAAPIARGDEVAGSLIAGYRVRKGPFSAKQRRVALGIAHAAGMALANSRLIAGLEAAGRLKSEFVAALSHQPPPAP